MTKGAPAPFFQGERMTTYYEKHPVSPERKQELRRKGYRILDARFKPSDWQDPEAPKPRRASRNAEE